MFAERAPEGATTMFECGGLGERWVPEVGPARAALRWCSVGAAVLLRAIAGGEVVRLEMRERGPFAGGHQFGTAGAYERIEGRMALEVGAEHPANARIHDLKLAPRNGRGRVECWTDFCLLKPVDAGRGNRRLLYDVNNRGNKLALWAFNGGERTNDPVSLAHAGNGFLMRQGYSVLWCGWSGEVVEDGTKRLLAGLPIATEGGRAITGRVHIEFCTAERCHSRAFSWSPWGEFAAFPAASLDNREATLAVRASREDPGAEVAREGWAFGRWENGRVISDPTRLCIKEGFRPGWLYDLIYVAKEPRVSGLGLTALRDCVSFFRYAEKDAAGAANPLAGSVEKACVFGISQSGRLIHHFLYEGLNVDEAGRRVFDGALIHVAGAGKGRFNDRFGMGTEAGTQHEGNLCGSEFFPLAPAQQTDPVTGETGDSLARQRAAGHVPKIIFTQSSTEYWTRAGSLLHTDVEGKADIELPDDVRVYLVAGAQHLGGGENTPGQCQQPRNNLDDRGPVLRAMLANLDAWLADGTVPPPSRYPRLADGTLVDLKTFRERFPAVPGVNLPERCYEPPRLEFGPRFRSEGIADIIPPKVGKAYRTLVPSVDADGNETAGIRLPDVAVPLGSYTGWNLRSPSVGAEKMLANYEGMFLPFARTSDERRGKGDPRPSVIERYPTRAEYLARMAEAVLRLRRERFLLAEDAVAILETAARRDLWASPQ